MNILRTELKIYRGTYAEIQQAETADMAIYFAWNTGEIFVGNALGVKVPYTGGESLTANQVITLITDQTSTQLTDIKSLLTLNNINYNTATTNALAALTITETYDTTLEAKVAIEMSTIIEEWENVILGDNYYNKTEINDLILPLATALSVSTLRDNIYTKLQIDNMGLGDIASDIEFQAYKQTVTNTITPYLSIQILDDGDGYSEENITTLIDGILDDGIYRLESTTNGYIILTVFGNVISRLNADGSTWVYNVLASTWTEYINPNSVTSINTIEPITGDVTLTADNINESATRIWNNLLPQTDNAINPLGRNTAVVVGAGSIGIGYQASAQALRSLALGYMAVATDTDSIQLGTGINNEPNTFNVGSYTLLTDGKIPQERITERFYEDTILIEVADWVGITSTVVITNMTADALVWVSPASSSYTSYGFFGIRATSQDINELVFECTETPTEDILINITWRV